MPTATPQYDIDGSWKVARQDVDSVAWESRKKRLQAKLRPYYPDGNAETDETFGHPSEGWANALLAEANSAVSIMLWLRLRLTKEKLRAEQKDVTARLRRAEVCLNQLSYDFQAMIDIEADIGGCRDKIRELLLFIEKVGVRIGQLPQAKKRKDAEHEAAVEMATRLLRTLKASGISIAATADTDLGYVSPTVSIIKIIGDEIGLRLAERTWLKAIHKAKANMLAL